MLRRTLIWLVVLSLALVACAGGGTAAAPTTAPSGSGPQKGGTVVLIIPEEPTTLNRFLADAAIVRQVADATSAVGLVTPNANGEYEPRLAAALPTLSDDKLTVTWKLRPGLKW
ncbi:MAG: hypothetical protein ACT4QE_23170, partial [Anaerolineales bacterium]